MKQTIFLICTKQGIQRMTKRNPSLYRGEVAVALSVTIPAGVFRPLSIPATLDIEEGSVIHPSVTVEALPNGQDEDVSQATEASDGQAGPGEVPAPGEVGSDG